MKDRENCKTGYIWIGIIFILWLVVNIRVEAGLGTSFERAVDGLVGGALLVTSVFLAVRFFSRDKSECRGVKPA